LVGLLDALDVLDAMDVVTGVVTVNRLTTDKISAMAQQPQRPSLGASRAAEKHRSRVQDARALASGRKSEAQLQHENEVFARLASRARVDLLASRSLG
jgi:hypothetical protein